MFARARGRRDRQERRLLLHLGMVKTGSTAIQTWCVHNRDWLRARGVHYPEHVSDRRALLGEPVPGNGTVLLPYIGPPEQAPGADGPGLADFASGLLVDDAPVTLCSNEKLYNQTRPPRLRELAEHLAGLGVTTQAVVYLRNIAPHAVSLYAQMVQQGATAASLAEYITGEGSPARYDLDLRARLTALRDVLGPENVIVLHYESHRGSLVDDLLSDVVGIQPDAGSETPPAPQSNRSLGLREVEWKRYLNGRLSGARKKSKAIGRRITMLAPLADDARLRIPAEGLEDLERRYRDEVAWVNQEFFDGDPVLSVAGDDEPLQTAQQPLELSDQERALLDWVAAATHPKVFTP